MQSMTKDDQQQQENGKRRKIVAATRIDAIEEKGSGEEARTPQTFGF